MQRERRILVATFLDISLLESADARAKSEGKSRSEWIREAVESKLKGGA